MSKTHEEILSGLQFATQNLQLNEKQHVLIGDAIALLDELIKKSKLDDSFILNFMDNWNYLRDVLSNVKKEGEAPFYDIDESFEECDVAVFNNAKDFSEEFALNNFRKIYERINKERKITCLNEHEWFKDFYFEQLQKEITNEN